MRSIFLICLLFSFLVGWSQSLPVAGNLSSPTQEIQSGDLRVHLEAPEPKWFVTSGVSMVSTVSFFKGNSATWFSVPASIQLNRRLSDHWYAFANFSAIPVYSVLTPTGGFLNPQKSLFQNPLNPYGPGVYSAASIGIFYTNTARTFSISGSFSASRGYSPLLGIPPPPNISASNRLSKSGR